MSTTNAPTSHSQTKGDLGYDYVHAEMEMQRQLEDQLNALGLGVVPLRGDLAGSGSDTVRVTEYGGVGWARRMSSLASETDTPVAQPILHGYSDIAIGMYGLAHSETYKQQVLGRPAVRAALSIDALKTQVPASWLATFRYLWCVTGATFSTVVGSATTQLSTDDLLDLIAAHREALGSGDPVAALSPQQLTQLVESLRNEPAFQNDMASFSAMQRFDNVQVKPNFANLNITVAVTDDIVQSGGAYQGFSHTPGGIGWAVANTTPIQTANPQSTSYVPEFGLVIEEDAEGSKQGIRQYLARAFFGLAKANATVGSAKLHTQRIVRSVV